ncbi:MAG: Histidine kinase, region:Bacterial chemotaxis sensory transducer [Proteobacteria bacterium]|nr:Histidine kinase, region:Bacterial chemotaxis sensory transducer [Pseudomonadota bacterium]
MNFANRSLTAKLVIIVSLGIAIILGGFALFLDRYVSNLSEKSAEQHLQQEVASVILMIDNYARERQQAVAVVLDTLAEDLGGDFSLQPERVVQIGDQATPTLKAGNVVLNLNLANLDRFRKTSGAVATIFAKQGDDFVRVATSLTKENGERAMGTLLGKSHPAYAKVSAGGEFSGRAKLFGRDYATRYKAIKSNDGKVIGVLFAGVDVTDGLKTLKDKVRALKIGETGYYYILDAHPGATAGTLIVHPVKEKEGTSIADATDSAGNAFIRQMLEKQQGEIRYPWINKEKGETSAREKLVVFNSIPEWEWLVAGGTYIDEITRDAASIRNFVLLTVPLVLIVVSLLLLLASRRLIAQPVGEVMTVFSAIGGGKYDNQVDTTRGDEIGSLMRSLDSMQKDLGARIEAEHQVANANLRVKTALDVCSTNMMLADNDGKIIYCNQAVLEMLRRAESDIRTALPAFRADAVLGASFDQFHRNPAHQRNMLASLQGQHRAEIEIGGRYFSLLATPVVNAEKERLGVSVEWQDKTAQVLLEREMAGIIDAAANGDFSGRFDTAHMQGFYLQLGNGLNQLLNGISRALDDVGTVLGKLSRGDLTEKIVADYSGMLGLLKDSVNATVDQLRDIVMQIQDSSEAINTASQEISSGNTDLSSRTEEQASSLEETASSMEELTSTVKLNADNAKRASELASNAQVVANKGGEVVSKVVATMGSINSSSNKIADIIGVIDGIAFQTNILALNAAVEAARAGEQGRGFAVVATEVRNLAQRSAAAAKEIKGLISDSASTVDVGSKLVEQAGITMDEVVSAIRSVATIMNDIAAASHEQSTGIEQVNIAVSQMDEMTQQNAALVEQAAAAAESLEDQAHSLVQCVSVFNLGRVAEQGAGRAARLESPRAKLSAPASVSRSQAPKSPAKMSALPDDDSDAWEEF